MSGLADASIDGVLAANLAAIDEWHGNAEE